MIARPCITCGDIVLTGHHCVDCKPTDTRVRKGKGQAAYDPVWRKLSIKARRLQPWCEDCGATEDLTADHILPKSDYPELVHAIENLTVRCRPCNSIKGATTFTHAEAHAVLTRLQATLARRPTKSGRDRVDTAQRAIEALGGGPQAVKRHPDGKAQGALHIEVICK